MILGLDVGNYGLKVNSNINVKSLVTEHEKILKEGITLEMDGKRYIIGDGNFETELNKSNKENFLPLLFTGIALSSKDEFNQVVVGLPINQYRTNKSVIENLIFENKMKVIKFNNEIRKIVIADFKVYPEGIGAYYSLNTNEDVIIVDIGGRTTDIAYIENKRNSISSTVATGTLNIYKSVADKLNSDYCLNLSILDAEKIIKRGKLLIDGSQVDLSFITDILKENFMKIKEDLDFKFPARTEQIILVGGGTYLYQKAFMKRYKNCIAADNPIFANSIGFQKVGEKLWK